MKALVTGYTVVVEEGCTWEEFVWRCTRAMGPLITMREDPLDAPVPKEFKPEKRYQKKLDEALAALARAKSLSQGEADRQAERDFSRLTAEAEKANAKTEEQRTRFRAMVAKTEAWDPPPDYVPLRRFMLEQLQLSYFALVPMPARQSGEDWRKAHVADAEQDVEYARAYLEQEEKRVAFQNRWLAGLRAIVPLP